MGKTEARLATIPNDPSVMRDLLLDVLPKYEALQREVQVLHRELHAMRHQLFGPSSEKMTREQLTLGFTTESFPVELPPTVPAAQPSEKRGHGRRRLPAKLPRVTTVCDVPVTERQCACGKELVKIGEEVTEQVEYTPATMHVNHTVRPKYGCPDCKDGVRIAPLPPQVIERGLPGPGLLAQVVVSKFADHLPLNRQQEIFARHGLEIARSTQCDWVRRVAELLAPIAGEVHKDVLRSKVINTDDTPVRVLEGRDPANGRVWVYCGDADHPQISYRYSPTHERRWPSEHLGDFSWYLQADAYKGYDALYANRGIVEVGCWAHCRRYFFEAQVADSARSLSALAFIHRLYDVEREAKEKSATERRAMRQHRSKPVVEAFDQWMTQQTVLPKSAIGEAIGYARRQWTALNRFLEDGDLGIDNSAAERALRRVAVGRGNWLFFGSDAGGERAAVLYTLIASCRVNGVEPFAYFRDVLVRIATHPASETAKLMPRLWRRATP